MSHSSATGFATRRCGSRRRFACDFDRVTDVLAQHRSVSVQCNVVSVAVCERVTAIVTAQAAFDSGGAAAGGMSRSALTGIVLCGGPERAQ